MSEIFIGVLGTIAFFAYSAVMFFLGCFITRKYKLPAKQEPAQPELTKEQLRNKEKRERLEEQFSRLFTYKRGS